MELSVPIVKELSESCSVHAVNGFGSSSSSATGGLGRGRFSQSGTRSVSSVVGSRGSTSTFCTRWVVPPPLAVRSGFSWIGSPPAWTAVSVSGQSPFQPCCQWNWCRCCQCRSLIEWGDSSLLIDRYDRIWGSAPARGNKVLNGFPSLFSPNIARMDWQKAEIYRKKKHLCKIVPGLKLRWSISFSARRLSAK